MEQTMQVPQPQNPMPTPQSTKPLLWTAVAAGVLIALHFIYDFAVYTGTVPQKTVPVITISLFVVELILVIYLIVKKPFIGLLFLALMIINVFINIPMVKFAVTHTATQKALQGDQTATKNLSPSEGLKVLNQEANKINQLNTQSGKLWNSPAPDFANMNNEQFQSFLQKLLDTYEERKKVIETFKSDYEKYKQYIDVKPGETPGFDKMYAWDFVSPSAIACYEAQYNTQVPIIKSSQKINYDTLTSEKKSTYYEDVFYPGIIESDKVCRNF